MAKESASLQPTQKESETRLLEKMAKDHMAPHIHSSSHNANPKEETTPKRNRSLSISLKNLFIKSPKLQPTIIDSPKSPQVHQLDNEERPASPHAISPTTIKPMEPLGPISDEPHLLEETGFVPLHKQQDNTTISRSSSLRTNKSPSSSTSRTPLSRNSSRKGSQDSNAVRSRAPIFTGPDGTFKVYEDGSHEHCLKPLKVLEKVPTTTSGILSGFLRKSTNNNTNTNDVAFSLLPEQNRMDFQKRLSIQSRKTFDENDEIEHENDESSIDGSDGSDYSDDERETNDQTAAINDNQLNLINRLVEKINNNEDPSLSSKNYQLSEKYGKLIGVIGKGSYGIVKLVSKTDLITKKEIFYAVKELKQKDKEDVAHFSTRLTSEFVISNSLNHINIVKTIDLMKNSSGVYSEIMEYCSAGDLFTLISKTNRNGLHYIEADCFMKQIINGVTYMHSKGVAHCDLKPENILLTTNGIAKISDFGTSAVFKTAWEKEVHFSSGACGSEPYVAPEEFLDKEYDPRLVDVWAVGVLYLTMLTGTYAWMVAKQSDELYRKYLQERPILGQKAGTFEPIENIENGENFKSRKSTLYGMLEPDVKLRLTALQVSKSSWMQHTRLCDAAHESEPTF